MPEFAAYRLTAFGVDDDILHPPGIFSVIRREPYPEELEEERVGVFICIHYPV